MKNVLIIDDDVKTSSKYKKWLEREEGFNSTLINDPQTTELNFKSTDYDLVLIGFRMSVMDGFNLYDKLHEISKKSRIYTKRISDMLYDFISKKLQSINRDSFRIWRRMLCFKRSSKRCIYKTY